MEEQIDQMHKKFYCKIEKEMTVFINHTTDKSKWICTSCQFITSKPKSAPQSIKYYGG